jgi:vancomycin resistance protein YoaR
MEIGGQTLETAKQIINTRADELLLNGLQMSVDGQLGTVPLSPIDAESGNYIIFDINKAVERLYSKSRSDSAIINPLVFLLSIIQGPETDLDITINKNELRAAVLSSFPESIQEPLDAGFMFEEKKSVWTGAISSSAKGLTIPTDELFQQLEQQLSELDPQPIVLERIYEEAKISNATAEELLPVALSVIQAAPYTLSFKEQIWKIEAATLAASLKPTIDENNRAGLTISLEGLKTILDEIAAAVETPAIDARLIIENGRVVDFQGSSSGISFDRETTIANLVTAFNKAEPGQNIELTTIVVEPTVKTESVNDLGIKEILGTGISNYKGSPTNRVKNIRNGVRLLNGILIPPDTEFSLLNALRPFDTDNGYLPELVIKGDKIEPEIGGGLCQIGTTTFRAAMNSGLPITVRSNHSLVVRYYNDPGNGNPGTDATIYDPAPDFKFLNNTGHYLLFQAEMDEANYTLSFSFWGTSDGRKGSYTPPTLVRWIPVGEEQRTETTDLEPGEEKCQEAHVGADASFVYSIENSDGTKTETVFDSHYRPLPRICLVGVEKKVEESSTTEPEESE